MGNYRTLLAWQVGMELVDAIYAAVALFPKAEKYRLGQQMTSAAVSIPSNIAEGKGRKSAREECQFLRHARGSVYELQTQIQIAAHQTFITAEEAVKLTALANRV